MGSISILFPDPVSKRDLGSLVVELIQYILYMRGQIPFTFEEGKKYIHQLQTKKETVLVRSSEIWASKNCQDSSGAKVSTMSTSDKENVYFPMVKSFPLNKAEQQLIQTMQNFENYFSNLWTLLCSQEIHEVVLNFGQNFRMPKELFHIKLPKKCPSGECSRNMMPFQKCKHYLFRRLIGNQDLANDHLPEIVSSLSVMLLVSPGIAITEHMEQKPLYSVPIKRISCEIELLCKCHHQFNSVETSMEHCDTDITDKLPVHDEVFKLNLWVQLKPTLKGFKNTVNPKNDDILF